MNETRLKTSRQRVILLLFLFVRQSEQKFQTTDQVSCHFLELKFHNDYFFMSILICKN